MAEESRTEAPPQRRSLRLASIYVGRALRLRCPVCGKSHIFVPVLRTRSLMNWFTPLDGCVRCGYPYEREPGYFLFSQWVLNFGFVVSVAIASCVALEMWGNVSTPLLLLATTGPAPILGIAVARHAKALFIAMDHFFDPFVHSPDDIAGWGDDDGDLPLEPTPGGGGAPSHAPDPGTAPQPTAKPDGVLSSA